jgi:AcrR family transcriptional regulator
VKRIRKNPEERKIDILIASIEMSKKDAYWALNFEKIAKKTNLSASLIYHYFKNIKFLEDEVIKRAVKQNTHEVIAQALVMDRKEVKKLSNDLKRESLLYWFDCLNKRI